ncbi:hypothetical protein DACRYDRAFT_97650 [Dacryopinax primogenitus]|uniref:Uncharacterized protein n=1 Tax=Dacryopinax primogenitus (strain DJM 731) TaxID=1858805 RepID=M5GF72_DACPD|nr:uncharacterized protein DACRYDRAFT_97650 [Dacryopinax primogenitus]EJU06017.1 hypothetical protein DACRYDRAFT_97650 [Dacryopinax primogenitus]
MPYIASVVQLLKTREAGFHRWLFMTPPVVVGRGDDGGRRKARQSTLPDRSKQTMPFRRGDVIVLDCSEDERPPSPCEEMYRSPSAWAVPVDLTSSPSELWLSLPSRSEPSTSQSTAVDDFNPASLLDPQFVALFNQCANNLPPSQPGPSISDLPTPPSSSPTDAPSNGPSDPPSVAPSSLSSSSPYPPSNSSSDGPVTPNPNPPVSEPLILGGLSTFNKGSHSMAASTMARRLDVVSPGAPSPDGFRSLLTSYTNIDPNTPGGPGATPQASTSSEAACAPKGKSPLREKSVGSRRPSEAPPSATAQAWTKAATFIMHSKPEDAAANMYSFIRTETAMAELRSQAQSRSLGRTLAAHTPKPMPWQVPSSSVLGLVMPTPVASSPSPRAGVQRAPRKSGSGGNDSHVEILTPSSPMLPTRDQNLTSSPSSMLPSQASHAQSSSSQPPRTMGGADVQCQSPDSPPEPSSSTRPPPAQSAEQRPVASDSQKTSTPKRPRHTEDVAIVPDPEQLTTPTERITRGVFEFQSNPATKEEWDRAVMEYVIQCREGKFTMYHTKGVHEFPPKDLWALPELVVNGSLHKFLVTTARILQTCILSLPDYILSNGKKTKWDWRGQMRQHLCKLSDGFYRVGDGSTTYSQLHRGLPHAFSLAFSLTEHGEVSEGDRAESGPPGASDERPAKKPWTETEGPDGQDTSPATPNEIQAGSSNPPRRGRPPKGRQSSTAVKSRSSGAHTGNAEPSVSQGSTHQQAEASSSSGPSQSTATTPDSQSQPTPSSDSSTRVASSGGIITPDYSGYVYDPSKPPPPFSSSALPPEWEGLNSTEALDALFPGGFQCSTDHLGFISVAFDTPMTMAMNNLPAPAGLGSQPSTPQRPTVVPAPSPSVSHARWGNDPSNAERMAGFLDDISHFAEEIGAVDENGNPSFAWEEPPLRDEFGYSTFPIDTNIIQKSGSATAIPMTSPVPAPAMRPNMYGVDQEDLSVAAPTAQSDRAARGSIYSEAGPSTIPVNRVPSPISCSDSAPRRGSRGKAAQRRKPNYEGFTRLSAKRNIGALVTAHANRTIAAAEERQARYSQVDERTQRASGMALPSYLRNRW